MVYVTEPPRATPRVDAGLLAGLCVTGAAPATAGLLAVLAARQAFPPGTRPERLRRDCPPGG